MSALLPTALLLLWSGVAATAVSAFIAAPLLGERGAALALAASNPTTTVALLLGIFVYPPIYALGFAIMQQATLATGALLGIAHAAVLALLTLRSGGPALLRASGGRLLLCLIYGAVLGFAFLMP